MEKKEVVSEFFKRKYLISPDIFEMNVDINNLFDSLDGVFKEKGPIVLNKDLLLNLNFLNNNFSDWVGFDKERVLLEKGRDTAYINFIKKIKKEELNKKESLFSIKPSVKILTNYTKVK
mgnify:FL=1